MASRSHLALAYQAAGRTTEAITLLEQTVADRELALGPDHPVTVVSRKHLSAIERDAGPRG